MPKKGAAQQRKRRRSPPWGKSLGGKPIERHVFVQGEQIDLGDEAAREQQYFKMLLLRDHYGIGGPVPRYPVAGLVDPSWLYWYKLALAIASELDDSLKIVDGRPPGKTAARWRGAEGAELIRLVDMLRKKNPKKSINWCLQQLQRRMFFSRMPLDQLVVRYYEARKHHGTTKRMRNSGRAS